jgi:hypothetical protein
VSDYLAVGGVSAVLMSLLGTALSNGGPTTILGSAAAITNKSPDLVLTGTDETAGINIFLYYASMNPALRNLGLPSANASGGRLSNPPLAINLHYLVTAYGSHAFDTEILLAWAMKVFHDTPVVPRDTIQQALADLLSVHPPPAENQLIAASTLASQVEHIRITPETLTTEEIYRLWTAFQTHYRPTTSYQVSVVVIQDTQGYQSNLPVRSRAVLALPLVSPVIDAVTPAMAPVGATLTLTGSNFLGDTAADTVVSFDGGQGVAAATVQGGVLRVVVPATLPDGSAVTAGTHAVRVQRNVTFPSSPRVHSGFSSNPVVFQVIPVIKPAVTPPYQAKLNTAFTLTLTPAVGVTQQVVFYFGDAAVPVPARPLTGPPSQTDITVTVPATLAVGTVPLRVEVDGAQSKLTWDATPMQYSPQVEVSA